MTGYQGRASGGPKNPYYIRRDGHLVAFTRAARGPDGRGERVLQQPLRHPVAWPGSRCCGAARTRKTRLDHRLIKQSDRFWLDRYFGSKPTFVFDEPIPVKEGNWIAITVPTWAPLLATNLATTNWWRSSRPRGSCEPPRSLEQFAMEDLREVNKFGCTYHGARLLYSVTYVPSNRVTNEEAG